MAKFNWTKQQLSPVIFSMRKLSDMLTKSTESCYIEGCKVFQDEQDKVILKLVVSDINGNLQTLFLKDVESEIFKFEAGRNTPPKLARDWKSNGLNLTPPVLRKELVELFNSLTKLEIPICEVTWDTLSSVSARLQLKKVSFNKAKNEYSLVFE